MKTDELQILYKKCQEESNEPTIFGEGNPNAKIMLIGEAPGAKEIEEGRPFVGQAGKNLDEFLNVLELKREDIFISNVVKIRPYKMNEETGRKTNRSPKKQEIKKYIKYLYEEIKIIDPKIIVTLGNVPLRAFLENDQVKIGDYHGKLIKKENFSIFPLYHPASILYNRSLKEVYLQDLYSLKKYVQELLN